jgi:hypothetical protein
MNEKELMLSQKHLRDELKRANNYLTRLIEKQLVQKAIAEKTNLKRSNSLPRDKAVALLQREIDNANQKKQMAKRELMDLEGKLKHVLDPEACEKIKIELQYLDEMIKGQVIDIQKMNQQNKAYQRFDFVQKDVEIERKLVHMEDERNRVKMKIDKLV